jgi:flagellar basal-body rod modification protein FlgD
MSVSNVNATTNSNDPTQTTAATASSTVLDKNAFLKLLVAQLSHQDPLQPMQGTEFVTQLSQFSLVEQSVQQSSTLSTLSTQLTGISNGNATSLVGKTVTVRASGQVAFDGVTAATQNVTLGSPASKVSVSVKDASGNVVRTMDLGSRPAGALSVVWNGKDDHGQGMPAGNYTFSVNATGANNTPVTVSQDTTGVVTSVSYDKGYPDLHLDVGVDASIANLVSVASTPTKP